MKFTIIITLILGLSGVAQAGSQSGGGGTVVYGDEGSAPILLDLYLHASATQRGWLSRPVSKSPLPRSPFQDASGIELMDPVSTRAFAVAQARLEAWRDQAPHLALAILGVLRHKIQLFHTNRPVVRYSDFYLPKTVEIDDVRHRAHTVIIYDQAFGPIVFAPIWNELHELSQAGLLIHESLRYFQGIHPGSLTDQNIQELTAHLVMSSPEAAPELESEGYLGQPLIETFALPFWRRSDEAADGVRFRLYFRWIRAHWAAINTEVARTPEPFATELRKRLVVIERTCTGDIAEFMEVRCAMVYAMVFGPWLDATERGSAAYHRLMKLRIADDSGLALPNGETAALWTFGGKLSPFYPVFYERLLLGTSDPNDARTPIDDQARRLPHPLIVRQAVNEGLPPPEGADQVIQLIKQYLELHIHKP